MILLNFVSLCVFFLTTHLIFVIIRLKSCLCSHITQIFVSFPPVANDPKYENNSKDLLQSKLYIIFFSLYISFLIGGSIRKDPSLGKRVYLVT